MTRIFIGSGRFGLSSRFWSDRLHIWICYDALFGPCFPLNLSRVNKALKLLLEDGDFFLPRQYLQWNLSWSRTRKFIIDSIDHSNSTMLTSDGISGSVFDSLFMDALAFGLVEACSSLNTYGGITGSSVISTSSTTALFLSSSWGLSGSTGSDGWILSSVSSVAAFWGDCFKNMVTSVFWAILDGDVVLELALLLFAILVLAALTFFFLLLDADSSLYEILLGSIFDWRFSGVLSS